MVRRLLVIFTLALTGLLPAAFAMAEGRVALVIGNDTYPSKDLPNLNNARTDAQGMASALERMGFEVILRLDATERQMGRVLREFENRLSRAEVGLVFYAGHGIQSQGVNWLVPSDAEIEIEADLDTQALDASQFLEVMARAGSRLNIVILDACRDNPLPQRSRSAQRGLARLSLPAGIEGTAILYSAGEGEQAQDGPPGGHGVFTGQLLSVIEQPGLKLEDVFKQTARRVFDATGGAQDPWFYSNIKGDFYFLTGDGDPLRPVSAGLDQETLVWVTIDGIGSREAYQSYLDRYPNGAYAGLARQRLAETAQPTRAAVATDPAQEATLWRGAQGRGTVAAYREYLAQYPRGTYASLAALNLSALSSAQAQPVPSPKENRAWRSATDAGSRQAMESYLMNHPHGDHANLARLKLAAMAGPARKVALFNFESANPTPELRDLSLGLTEDLWTDLTRLPSFSVIRPRGEYDTDAQRLAGIAKLGAKFAVVGRIQKSGDAIRINARVIDTENGQAVWSDRLDGRLSDVFDLQDRISSKIVAAMKGPVARIKPPHAMTLPSPEIYQMYLQARRQEGNFTPQAYRQARDLYEEVLAVAPHYAPARAHYATVLEISAFENFSADADGDRRQAIIEARQAVADAPDYPYGLWALARILGRAGENDEAISVMYRALALDPEYADAMAIMTSFHLASGRYDLAEESIESAMTMTDRAPAWNLQIRARVAFMQRDWDTAIKWCEAGLERNPTSSWSLRICVAANGHLGKRDDAEWHLSEMQASGQLTTIAGLRDLSASQGPVFDALFLEGLRKAGMPEE